MKLNMIEDASHVWHRLWSLRLTALSAALSAAEFALPMVPDGVAEFVGRGKFAAAAFVLSMAAAGARLVSQPKLRKEQDDA